MFTGLIKTCGKVKSIEDKTECRRIGIAAEGIAPEDLQAGASIACSGCCLTVTSCEDGVFMADISPETLSRTTLGTWKAGTRVNLEPSLRAGDPLGGHMVTGHVDGTASLISSEIDAEGQSRRLRFRVSQALAGYIAVKGSIALDGISLTVNEVIDEADSCLFGVTIIPHTREVTNIGDLDIGDEVNIEIDILARYVARYHESESENDCRHTSSGSPARVA